MADKKISQLSAASTPLTGNELVELVQSGNNVKATAQDVADLVDLTAIQSDITTIYGDISTIQGDITTAETNITALQSDMATAQSDISALQSGKQDNLTLTTTGTSGAATLVGSTLNVPDYSAGMSGGITHTTASGTDTYTATITGVTSYADGDAYLIRFTNGNTSSATLNINSIGAVTLYRNNDGALIGGDIWDGAEMLCVYNSTLGGFQCIGTSPNSIFAYVTNTQGSTITKGQVVYAFGGTGDRMTVKLANNTSDATSAKTVGVVASTSIGINQKGIIILQGLLTGLSILPTSTYADGDSLYLGATDGAITKVKQYAPNHLVYVATVTTASNGTSGRMYVRVQNGYELDELHNVQAQSPALKDTLYYDTADSQWKTNSISGILGYTPEDVANKQTNLTASATKYPTVDAVNTGLGTKENSITAGTTAQYWRGDKSWQTLDKTAVGLSNVDNTSDANKPISTATQTALNLLQPLTPRLQTTASAATVTPTSTNDIVTITAQASALLLANPTGTWQEGQPLIIRIKDNGTARAISFDTNYRAIGITLPTTTVISKTIYLGIIYNNIDTKWDVIGYNLQA